MSLDQSPNHTHQFVIQCDENDADYIDTTIDYTPGDKTIFLDPTDVGINLPGKTMEEFIKYGVIPALQAPRAERHNWSRSEYDSPHAANETCRWVVMSLYGIDPDADEYYNELTDAGGFDALVEHVKECISDNFPYGEFGFHTVASIKSQPKSALTTLYTAPNYWQWREWNPVFQTTDLAVFFAETGELAFYNTTIDPDGNWLLWDQLQKKFVKCGYHNSNGFAHVLDMGGRIVWNKNA